MLCYQRFIPHLKFYNSICSPHDSIQLPSYPHPLPLVYHLASCHPIGSSAIYGVTKHDVLQKPRNIGTTACRGQAYQTHNSGRGGSNIMPGRFSALTRWQYLFRGHAQGYTFSTLASQYAHCRNAKCIWIYIYISIFIHMYLK